MIDPIEQIQWIDVDKLSANGWNPNVVMNQELQLLEFNILKHGWIQPIIINRDNIIIDGFHRSQLSRMSKKLREKYKGLVPCVIFDISEAEAMMLTIRINRAKGSHVAFKMGEIIQSLVDKFGFTPKQIGEEIGAYKGEIELLYQNTVFKRKDIQNHTYSRAWEPKK